MHHSTSLQQIVEGRGGEISSELVDRELLFISFKFSRQFLACREVLALVSVDGADLDFMAFSPFHQYTDATNTSGNS